MCVCVCVCMCVCVCARARGAFNRFPHLFVQAFKIVVDSWKFSMLLLCIYTDFLLFPKLRGCRYETIEEVKEALTKFIDTLTQEEFYGAFQKLLERYNKCIAASVSYSCIEYIRNFI